MKALRYGALIVALAIAGLLYVQSAKTQEAGRVSDRERLIGAWHLEHIDSPEPDGKPSDIPQPSRQTANPTSTCWTGTKLLSGATTWMKQGTP